MIFDVLTVVNIEATVFWDVAPYRRFLAFWSNMVPHLQGGEAGCSMFCWNVISLLRDYVTSQKIAVSGSASLLWCFCCKFSFLHFCLVVNTDVFVCWLVIVYTVIFFLLLHYFHDTQVMDEVFNPFYPSTIFLFQLPVFSMSSWCCHVPG
jgi:hypothetical protein